MKSLHGIWESGTRKQNGHYQSGAGDNPPPFEIFEIEAGKGVVSVYDTNNNSYIFGAPGYVPVDTISKIGEIVYTSQAGATWTLENYGTHDYKPTTDFFDNIVRQYPYIPNWYKFWDAPTGTYKEIDLGSGLASGIVREWLCPTFEIHILKHVSGSTTITRQELNNLFDPGKIIMNNSRYQKIVRTNSNILYDNRLNQVPPLNCANDPDSFEAKYINPPLPSPWHYTDNTDIVEGWATNWKRLADSASIRTIDIGDSDSFFKANQVTGYYKSGGVIWIAVLRKLLVKQYPMTS